MNGETLVCGKSQSKIISTQNHTPLVPHPTKESTHLHKQLHCSATVLPDAFASTIITTLDLIKTNHWKHTCKSSRLPAHEKKVPWPTGPTPKSSSARRGLPHMHRCTTRELCMACYITDMCCVPGTDYQPLTCPEQTASCVQACAPWVCMHVCGSVTMALHAVGASINPAIQPCTQTTMLCQCYSCMLTNVCCIRTLTHARSHQTRSLQTLAGKEHCLQMLAVTTQCMLQANTHSEPGSWPQMLTHRPARTNTHSNPRHNTCS